MIAPATIDIEYNYRFYGLPLKLEYVDGRRFRIVRDISYLIACGRFAGHHTTVRAPYIFDFASVPRLFWRLFPPAGDGYNRYGIAAAWHDWLYEHAKISGIACTRREADNLFREIMLALKVRRWIARTMWLAVRSGGWWAWRNYRRKDPIR